MILIIIIIKFLEKFPENWANFTVKCRISMYDFEMRNFQYLFSICLLTIQQIFAFSGLCLESII